MRAIVELNEREGRVLQELSNGETVAAVARRYKTTPGRIRTIRDHANRKAQFAARLRKAGLFVSEVVV